VNEQIWKLQDAKARFSELIRRARTGEKQRVTVHGRDAVVIVDPQRYEVTERSKEPRTLADFFRRSRKYRLPVDVEFERPFPMQVRRPVFARRRKSGRKRGKTKP
jgi:prevent-host-death family protein